MLAAVAACVFYYFYGNTATKKARMASGIDKLIDQGWEINGGFLVDPSKKGRWVGEWNLPDWHGHKVKVPSNAFVDVTQKMYKPFPLGDF